MWSIWSIWSGQIGRGDLSGRMVRLGSIGSGDTGGPGCPGGSCSQDDQPRWYAQEIYGFHGLNHQIIDKSHACDTQRT